MDIMVPSNTVFHRRVPLASGTITLIMLGSLQFYPLPTVSSVPGGMNVYGWPWEYAAYIGGDATQERLYFYRGLALLDCVAAAIASCIAAASGLHIAKWATGHSHTMRIGSLFASGIAVLGCVGMYVIWLFTSVELSEYVLIQYATIVLPFAFSRLYGIGCSAWVLLVVIYGLALAIERMRGRRLLPK